MAKREDGEFKVIPLYEENPECDVLIIHCVDYRIQTGVDQLCSEHLKIHGEYNRLSIPGGALEFQTNRQWLMGVVDLYRRIHQTRRIVMLSHIGCSACRDFLTQSKILSSEDQAEECERGFLVAAMEDARFSITKEHPDMTIDLYMYEENGTVAIVEDRQLYELIKTMNVNQFE